ncbi:pentraxin-4 [Tamandua tetradactyla]|uniref:pentraxin-4 n=1 Tax=Tamandua tetradactyla TaxID=48850 RepID=UPI004053AC69
MSGAGMGRLGWQGCSLCLLLVPACLFRAVSQEAGTTGQRKPFLERLRGLEEQFRRFREVTATYLQGIARNYNVSYNVDARFQSLEQESRAMALAATHSRATVQADLGRLRAGLRRTRRRGRTVDAELRGQATALSSLAAAVQALQDSLARLSQDQGARLAALEGRLQEAGQEPAPPGLTTALAPPKQPGPSPGGLHGDRQALRSSPQDPTSRLWETGDPRGTVADPREPPQWAWSPQRSGGICNVGPALIFPNASTENAVFLRPGLQAGLRALSVCSWARMAAGHLGTLLSYATRDNDNKLVLHGSPSLVPGSLHFVIGDPAFRELPLQLLLDGQWHHLCVIWTSIQGRHWLYVDRRLVATGSHFREGYEIPPGGVLVLGQEQDSMGGGFDSSEAFVGSLAGLAIWDRALAPGEVASLASGKELPPGAILTLANATPVGGFVQMVTCTCLELCP